MLQAPSFEESIKNIKGGLVKCWYCDNLSLIEEAHKVSVASRENNQTKSNDEWMCDKCYLHFEEDYPDS